MSLLLSLFPIYLKFQTQKRMIQKSHTTATSPFHHDGGGCRVGLTLDELKNKNFEKFIIKHEAEGYHKGFLKVQPPPSFWQDIQVCIPENVANCTFRPCKQKLVRHTKEITLKVQKRPIQLQFYLQSLTPQPKTKLSEYRARTERKEKNVERNGTSFWNLVPTSEPSYGADLDGSRCSLDSKYWSLPKLNTLFHRVCTFLGVVLIGVTTPNLYYGEWLTKFCWHVEDLQLFSISFHHEGAPKTWYIIPPAYQRQFESLVRKLCPAEFNQDLPPKREKGQKVKGCDNFLHHKRFFMNPTELRKAGIPYEEVVQHQGDIMITFPGAYHCGFNHGFNCAEAVNFALPSWIPFGRTARVCHHNREAVRLTRQMMAVAKYMEIQFYSKFRPLPNLTPLATKGLCRPLSCPGIQATGLYDNGEPKYVEQTRNSASPAKKISDVPIAMYPSVNDKIILKIVRTSSDRYVVYTYRRSAAYKIHNDKAAAVLISLDGGTKYQCQYCGKFFAKKKYCLEHNAIVHERRRTWKRWAECRVCQKSFYNVSNLRKHVKNIHRKNRNF